MARRKRTGTHSRHRVSFPCMAMFRTLRVRCLLPYRRAIWLEGRDRREFTLYVVRLHTFVWTFLKGLDGPVRVRNGRLREEPRTFFVSRFQDSATTSVVAELRLCRSGVASTAGKLELRLTSLAADRVRSTPARGVSWSFGSLTPKVKELLA